MRSFVAFVALLLAAVSTTAALAAYLAHETVLDPSNAGKVLSRAVDSGDLRDQVLSRALPGYDSLPAQYRGQVDRVAESKKVDRALSRVQIDAQGNADIGSVRQQIATGLRDAGYGPVADRVASAGGRDTVQLPQDVWRPYQDARETSWLVATRGALLAGALYLVALLISPRRRGMLAAGAVALLLSGGAAYVLVRNLPSFASEAGADPWMVAAARVAVPTQEAVLPLLVPLAVLAGGLLVASLLAPRRTA
jgi:hypothetical protein